MSCAKGFETIKVHFRINKSLIIKFYCTETSAFIVKTTTNIKAHVLMVKLRVQQIKFLLQYWISNELPILRVKSHIAKMCVLMTLFVKI